MQKAYQSSAILHGCIIQIECLLTSGLLFGMNRFFLDVSVHKAPHNAQRCMKQAHYGLVFRTVF